MWFFTSNKIATPKKTTTGGKKKKYNASGYSINDALNIASNTSSGDWSGGVYRPDTSQAIAAYNREADALRANAKSQYDTTIDDLVTKMNRFRESNEKSRNNQKQSYLTNQSAIEMAKEQADRQSRISNAARGLGGSGLQNIAEIQNELGVQGDISKLAGENQFVMDDLTSQLKQAEEDTEKGKRNAKTVYDNSLRSIASDLANKIAQVNYEADNIYNQSLASARSAAAANTSARASDLYGLLNGVTSGLANRLQHSSLAQLKKDFNITKKNATYKDISNAIYNTYMPQIRAQGLDANTYRNVESTLNSLLRTFEYNNTPGKGKKKTTYSSYSF